MRILHLTTQGEPCGIGDYDSKLRHNLAACGHISEFYRIPLSEFAFATKNDISQFFDKFVAHARSYDAVIIEHEYGFFSGPHSLRFGLETLSKVLHALSSHKVILISHTDPSLIKMTRRRTLRSLFSSKRRALGRVVKAINHTKTKLVVHGSFARRAWINVGVRHELIENLYIPLELPSEPSNNQLPYDGKRPVWLAMFGFIGEYKGYQTALEALNFLPENFCLLIIGGIHPRANNEFAVEKINRFRVTGVWPDDLQITKPVVAISKFEKRITITGYVATEKVAEYMKQCDLVLAPYHEGGPSGSAAVAVGLKSGKPVIATKTRSFEEIHHQSQGLKMVTPGAPAELGLTIEKLMENPSERSELVEQIYKYGKNRGWSDYIAQLGLNEASRGPVNTGSPRPPSRHKPS
jgi:glycosyltransferase involved in cell wall biosynthesis